MWGFHLRMNLLAQLTQQCKTNFRRNNLGAVAQLGERLHGMQEVVGSSPIGSTRSEKNQSLRGWFFFFAVWIRVPAAPSLCCLWQQLARVRIALRQFDCEPDRLHSLRKKPITLWLVFLLSRVVLSPYFIEMQCKLTTCKPKQQESWQGIHLRINRSTERFDSWCTMQ